MTQVQIGKVRAGTLGRDEGIYIGRIPGPKGVRSRWQNPYRIGHDGSRSGVLKLFEQRALPTYKKEDFEELKGMTLLCHCADGEA